MTARFRRVNGVLSVALFPLMLASCFSPTSDVDTSDDIDYFTVGEPATLENLRGAWQATSNASSLNSTYVFVRDDGTYMKAVFHAEALASGQVDCFTTWETDLYEYSEGLFSVGGTDYHIFTYEQNVGYYRVDWAFGTLALSEEYERSSLSEEELFPSSNLCET